MQAVRSVAFEDVANYFVFPCKFDKCNRVLERHEMGLHELKCEYGAEGCCSCWRRCGVENLPPPKPKGLYYINADDKTHELITCVHCFGYLSALPIFIRPNGTYICYRCGPDLQAPPVIRDKPLEELLDCFIIKCSYRMNGCQERYRFGQEIIEHEANCNYNPQKQFHSEPPPINPSDGQPGGGNTKIKGVIATIASGHIYATITPNHFNQYQKYGQQMEENKMRQSQMIPRISAAGQSCDSSAGVAPVHAHSTNGSVRGHRKQESQDLSTRSSISIENHHWDQYNGAAGADDTKYQEDDDEDDARKYIRTAKVAGIGVTRNESILYNNVVTEMKYKQHLKKTPAPNVPE